MATSERRRVKLGLRRKEDEKYVGVIFDDLRRTFVTGAEHSGAPRHEVMAITGHKTESVYTRYAIERYREERKGRKRGESPVVPNGRNP